MIFTEKRIYDMAKEKLCWLCLDEKRIYDMAKKKGLLIIFRRKKNIWHGEKKLCWLSFDEKRIYDMAKKAFFWDSSSDEKRIYAGCFQKKICFVFVAFVVGAFTLTKDDVCFNRFLLRWLRGKAITGGRCPMHSELRMFDARCTVNFGCSMVDARCTFFWRSIVDARCTQKFRSP